MSPWHSEYDVDYGKEYWYDPPEKICEKCDKRLVLEHDMDDWFRDRSYYRDPDGGDWNRKHVCFNSEKR